MEIVEHLLSPTSPSGGRRSPRRLQEDKGGDKIGHFLSGVANMGDATPTDADLSIAKAYLMTLTSQTAIDHLCATDEMLMQVPPGLLRWRAPRAIRAGAPLSILSARSRQSSRRRCGHCRTQRASSSSLHLAASPRWVRPLSGARPRCLPPLQARDSCMRPSRPQVQRVLERDWDLVNVIDRDGHTALHAASAVGSAPVARLLLSKGANPSTLDFEGYTPLHWAGVRCPLSFPPPLRATALPRPSARSREQLPRRRRAPARQRRGPDDPQRLGADGGGHGEGAEGGQRGGVDCPTLLPPPSAGGVAQAQAPGGAPRAAAGGGGAAGGGQGAEHARGDDRGGAGQPTAIEGRGSRPATGKPIRRRVLTVGQVPACP